MEGREMDQKSIASIIKEQSERALWEVKNVIDCVPEELWEVQYSGMPCWKHIYHMLHSLDLWFINPRDQNYQEPIFHEKDLNNLDVTSTKYLTKEELVSYFTEIEKKLAAFLSGLRDDQLMEYPPGCEYCRFTLIVAQFRHLHTHMGMIMGFLIRDKDLWPRVLGLETPFPAGVYCKYF